MPTEAACPLLDEEYVPPEITLGTTAGRDDIRMRLGVERAVAFSDPRSVWIGHPATSLNVGRSVLVGGSEVGLGLILDGVGFDSDATIVGLTGVLRLDGERPRPLVVRFVPSDDGSHGFPHVEVPDVDRAGTLELRVQWVDRCFAYSAVGDGHFWIVSTATVRACPKGSAFLGYVDSRPPQAELNGKPIQLLLTEQVSRFSTGAVSGQGPALSSWSRSEPAVSAPAGKNARLTIGRAEFLLDQISARFYRRRDVTALMNGAPYPEPIVHREAETTSAGALLIRVPDEVGRFVVVLSFQWGLPCAYGSGVSVLSLDVD